MVYNIVRPSYSRDDMVWQQLIAISLLFLSQTFATGILRNCIFLSSFLLASAFLIICLLLICMFSNASTMKAVFIYYYENSCFLFVFPYQSV